MKTFFYFSMAHMKERKARKNTDGPDYAKFPLVITFDASVSFSDVTEGNGGSHVDG